MTLRAFHRTSAAILFLFIGLHLVNHTMLFVGVDAHIAFMDVIRPIYRNRIGQCIVLAIVGWQIFSGTVLIWRARYQLRGAVIWLQAGSGATLLLFLFIHVSAVIAGQISGVNTNIYFALAGYYNGMAWFFVPYYWLAIAALFTHLGCAVYWNLRMSKRANRFVLWTIMAMGGLFATLLTVNMAGWIDPIIVPAAYLNP